MPTSQEKVGEASIPYSLDQTLRLLFISLINFVRLLFESGDYSRAAFISLSQSHRWHRRERSSIEWLLDRQENLLVVADWFTSFFWVRFVSSRWVFACGRAILKYLSRPLRLLFESSIYLFSLRGGAATVRERLLINREQHLIERIRYTYTRIIVELLRIIGQFLKNNRCILGKFSKE